MKFLYSYYRLVLWVFLFSIVSCYTNDAPETFYESSFKVIDSNSNNSIIVIIQLTNFLGPGDSFHLNNSGDLFNTLVFESVHDFINYKNNHIFYFNSEVINNYDGSHTTRFKDIFNKTSSINVAIDQKLDHEDDNQSYIIKNILSELNGNTFGKNWEQIEYDFSLLNGTSIIDLYGKLHYKISISGIGFDFNDTRHYKLIIDIHTGILLSVLDADE